MVERNGDRESLAVKGRKIKIWNRGERSEEQNA